MQRYDIPISRYYEVKCHLIGRVISASCYFMGWFMPYFFAGKLESGNVCEYFVMIRHFHSLGIKEHDQILYEMGMKEKDHEVYFLKQIQESRLLPFFEKIFSWGKNSSFNDVDLGNKYSPEKADEYCQSFKSKSNI